jgi:hypothetical protein
MFYQEPAGVQRDKCAATKASTFDLYQVRRAPAAGIYGMRHNAVILLAWYSWFAVLVGALVYFLFG